MVERLAQFKTSLEEFALKYRRAARRCAPPPPASRPPRSSALTRRVGAAAARRADITRDPAFRAQFHAMCAAAGVDPLASNKGFWTELLGFGDFYYELGVQIGACRASSAPRPR